MVLKIALIAGLGSILAFGFGPMAEKGPRDIEVNGASYPFNVPNGLKEGYIGETPQILSAQSVWEFRLRNSGPKELANIQFKLPFSGFYLIRDGNTARQGSGMAKFNRMLGIERLLPGQYLVVTLWTAEKQDKEFEQSIRVTSNEGVLDVEYPIEPSGLLAWLERNKALVGLSLVVLILMVVL